MRKTVTLVATKAAMRLSQLTGRGAGAALPGLISEKLYPELGHELAQKLPHGVILVTGTNGKTTTTKLLAAALEAQGERVLTNKTGSNLRRGILSSLIAASKLTGRLKYTIGLFEVDEASLRQVVPLVDPRLIIVLNLFRDQLDRYGELDKTAALIGEGISNSRAAVVLNADDALVASLARYAPDPQAVSFFGIEGLPAIQMSSDRSTADSDRCPICGQRLIFERVFYAHVGHYRCPNDDFGRPQPEVVMTHLEKADLTGSTFEVSVMSKRYPAQLALPGTYNLYNGLAVLAAANALELDIKSTLEAIAQAGAAFGRVEEIELAGRHIYLLLIKNPTGFSQIMETFLLPDKNFSLLLAINDNFADGRDVSWLWDVPLERLADLHPHIITSGLRATDMALRFKYAELEAKVESDLAKAVDELIEQTPVGDTAYILPTYTAMVALRKLVSARAGLKKVTQL